MKDQERRITYGALDLAHIGSIDISTERKSLLRQATLVSQCSDVVRQGLTHMIEVSPHRPAGWPARDLQSTEYILQFTPWSTIDVGGWKLPSPWLSTSMEINHGGRIL